MDSVMFLDLCATEDSDKTWKTTSQRRFQAHREQAGEGQVSDLIDQPTIDDLISQCMRCQGTETCADKAQTMLPQSDRV